MNQDGGSLLPYKHTQAGTVIRWSVLLGLLPLAFLLWSPPGIPVLTVLFLVVTLAALGSALLLWSLTIEVTPAHFRFWFGPGLFGKTVPMALVASCEPVDGIRAWGIHWAGKKGWLYNVSGFKAVALTLSDGKRFRVGTDEPEAVCEAVVQARAEYSKEDSVSS